MGLWEEKKTREGTLSCQGSHGHWLSRRLEQSREDREGLGRRSQGTEGGGDYTSNCEHFLLSFLSPQHPFTEWTWAQASGVRGQCFGQGPDPA